VWGQPGGLVTRIVGGEKNQGKNRGGDLECPPKRRGVKKRTENGGLLTGFVRISKKREIKTGQNREKDPCTKGPPVPTPTTPSGGGRGEKKKNRGTRDKYLGHTGVSLGRLEKKKKMRSHKTPWGRGRKKETSGKKLRQGRAKKREGHPWVGGSKLRMEKGVNRRGPRILNHNPGENIGRDGKELK